MNDGFTFMDIYSKHYDTEEIRAIIEKYGIDYRDKYGWCILDIIHMFSEEQIDVIMGYHPTIDYEDGKVQCFGSCGGKTVYIMKIVLERDDRFLYVTRDTNYLAYPGKTYLEQLRYISTIDCLATRKGFGDGKKLIIMLENHEKRYYRLFDLLLPLIDDNNNNKKSRVY